MYKIQIQKRNGEINHIHPVFTTDGWRHFEAWFEPLYDVTSPKTHAFDSDVLISLVLNNCVASEASFYCVGIGLVDSFVTSQGPNWCIEPAVCQNGNHMIGIFSLIIISLLYFWIWFLWLSVCTANNSAQDMKRSLGGHFL